MAPTPLFQMQDPFVSMVSNATDAIRIDQYPEKSDFDGIWGVWDEPFFRFFAGKLSSFKQPFLASIFSVSSHHPFKVPEKYTGKFKKGPAPIVEVVGYTDFALRELFDEISSSSWFKNTLFIITADRSYSYSCLSKLKNGNVGLLYETVVEGKSTINFTSFSIDYIKKGDPSVKPAPYFSIPLIDLDGETQRQVIVDKEKGQYLGHPTTVLLEDKKTILTVYPKGHGRGGIVYKRSNDTGLTWSERLPTPESWSTSMEVPTLYPVVDKYGKRRLIMFSGLYPTRMAVSEDNGNTWSELEQVGDWGGIVVMGCMIPLKTGKGHYMTFFHDDMRYFGKTGQKKYDEDVKNFKSRMFTLYKSVTEDGGLTWSYPEIITKSREIHICEPGVIRSI